MSITNHRLYRQGRLYNLRVGCDKNYSGTATVYALRNDWMIRGAWKKAFETFMNNNKEEMALLVKKGGKARWQDFRVLHGITGGGIASVDPVEFDNTLTATRIVSGEFEDSVVSNEAGSQSTFTWGLGTASSFSMLDQYNLMGNTNSNPTAPTSVAAYGTLDDDTQNLQVSHLADAGNLPPYSQNGMEETTPWVKIATIGGGAQATTLSTGYFDAPCGLFLIVTDSATGVDNPVFFAEFKNGTYKGITAESMGEAKLVKNHYQVK